MWPRSRMLRFGLTELSAVEGLGRAERLATGSGGPTAGPRFLQFSLRLTGVLLGALSVDSLVLELRVRLLTLVV